MLNVINLLNFFLLIGNRRVAVKIQKLTPDTQALVVEEYRVYRDFAGHPNLPDFYGIYRKRSGKKSEFDQIWFVIEVSFIFIYIVLNLKKNNNLNKLTIIFSKLIKENTIFFILKALEEIFRLFSYCLVTRVGFLIFWIFLIF